MQQMGPAGSLFFRSLLMKVYMMGLCCSKAFVRNASIVFISSVYDQEGYIMLSSGWSEFDNNCIDIVGTIMGMKFMNPFNQPYIR
jgi:hypothetical protein